MQAPLFRALDALAVDHTGGGAGLPPGLVAAHHIEHVVDFRQRAVVVPQAQIVMQRALRWQILGDIPPLATGAEHIQEPIDQFTLILLPPPPATLGRRYQRRDK